MPNVELTAQPASKAYLTGDLILHSRSWRNGAYGFHDLEDSEYLITAIGEDGGNLAKIFARPDTRNADLIVPEPGQKILVSGWVLDTSGVPVGAARATWIGSRRATTYADSQGYFELEVTPRTMASIGSLEVAHDSYEKQLLDLQAYAGRFVEDELQLEAVLQPLPSVVEVAGRIRDTRGTPLADETVWLYSASLGRHYSAKSDATGAFVIDSVAPARDYRVQVRPDFPYRDYERYEVRIEGGRPRLDIELEIAPVGDVAGEMIDVAGRPVSDFGLWLTAAETDGQPIEVEGDELGYFWLQDVPAGQLRFHSRTSPKVQITGLYLPAGGTKEATLVLDRGRHEFTGRVVDGDNRPIAGAALRLDWLSYGQSLRSRVTRETVTDLRGQFHFRRLGPGPHTLHVRADGFETVRLQQDVGFDPDGRIVRLDMCWPTACLR